MGVPPPKLSSSRVVLWAKVDKGVVPMGRPRPKGWMGCLEPTLPSGTVC